MGCCASGLLESVPTMQIKKNQKLEAKTLRCTHDIGCLPQQVLTCLSKESKAAFHEDFTHLSLSMGQFRPSQESLHSYFGPQPKITQCAPQQSEFLQEPVSRELPKSSR